MFCINRYPYFTLVRHVRFLKALQANPASSWTFRADCHDLGQCRLEPGAILTLPNTNHTVALVARWFQLNEGMSALKFDQNVLWFGLGRAYGSRWSNVADKFHHPEGFKYCREKNT